jgi:ubiquitin C-terminal hydrolase
LRRVSNLILPAIKLPPPRAAPAPRRKNSIIHPIMIDVTPADLWDSSISAKFFSLSFSSSFFRFLINHQTNRGATCYLNSLLQSLYMVSSSSVSFFFCFLCV